MEFGSIIGFLENRSILVTGATGFLAKIFIEKILRVQPNVKKLYALLRAADAKTAALRFNNEVIAKELFKVLKENCAGNLNSLLAQKVRVVAGDITTENMGVKDASLLEEMWNEVDVVINLAANTNFDERYDVSMGINTLGAMHVLNFSKKCNKLKVHLHVSTAYVAGERSGLILETPYKMGETLNGEPGLDIDLEKKLIDDTLKQLKAEQCSEDYVKSTMKDLGIQRARKFGWPNTYVFTKAMGEMLLGQLKENIPLVIVRPTIVTSTYKDPFPGWAEGVRTIDSLTVGYGKGRISCFLGDPKAIIDLIPADMVVNAMIVAMVAHANQANETIYHIGSSVSNPVEFATIQNYGQRYFMTHPWINKEGRPVIVGNVTVLNSMESFQRYLTIHYLLPLKGLQILNTACCQYFQGTYVDMCRKIKFVLRLVELYAPYLFYKGYFDDMNAEKLRRAAVANGVEVDKFNFDPKTIKWDEYFMGIHLPGVVKHVLK
ncbi:alcohol-forming fatty acyl-CoA reductase-like [Andrographis paniculata]|uniref:alcohol-forming fatty acyl-CoA reductase-like n=1 Tax=Andrographis paniculata TaxID=175694 RepID=UPI0021E8D09B|nr:alcohol-forming fatty acyl-CoA reductase-like [Andrographis paniculata]